MSEIRLFDNKISLQVTVPSDSEPESRTKPPPGPRPGQVLLVSSLPVAVPVLPAAESEPQGLGPGPRLSHCQWQAVRPGSCTIRRASRATGDTRRRRARSETQSRETRIITRNEPSALIAEILKGRKIRKHAQDLKGDEDYSM